ncbi:MAG TPA: hypothetical protein PKB06_12670 [Actinotalea sp.]|nr:hypothetical protein [Actinotalea sp.]
MATFSSVQRQHVLQAIAEYDTHGTAAFLDLYGFEPVRGYTVVHEGHSYDCRALLGVAHKYATGRLATPEEFNGGMHAAVAILRKRGFDVTEPAGVDRPAAPRRAAAGSPRTMASTSRAPVRRSPSAERPAAICPTCFTALPATGVCDACG